jgi:hypothetical protein
MRALPERNKPHFFFDAAGQDWYLRFGDNVNPARS